MIEFNLLGEILDTITSLGKSWPLAKRSPEARMFPYMGCLLCILDMA